MEYLCTPCCREKRPNPGLLPAIERYLDPRIGRVVGESHRRGVPALILSGRFGLLAPHDAIPFYDQALLERDVGALVPRIAKQLEERGVSALRFLALPRKTGGWPPYYAALEGACTLRGIPLEVELLSE